MAACCACNAGRAAVFCATEASICSRRRAEMACRSASFSGLGGRGGAGAVVARLLVSFGVD